MGKLTDEQKNFDVSQFFDPDAPSGEPVLNQVEDPFTGDIHAPGLVVKKDGSVEFRNERDRRSSK